MSANVGPGVLARMAELGDSPLTDEVYHTNKDGSKWSETWGSQGRYIASNVSGEWRVAGPFRG